MRLGGGVAARRAEEIADLPVRLALGGTMLYHGLSKLRGEGPAQTSQMFESLGLTPGRPLAIATGVTEALAGAAAILGIGTRAAALAVLATQAVAIWKVHGPKGYSNMQGGMEYNLSIAAMSLGLLLTHPGVLSLHRAATRGRARARGVPGWLTRAQPGFADRALAVMH
ncbi:DoxX family protein [Anaeromyxobacter oryzisoli]|uniref:DoxX family protein n=1 Tax=Anaeromyxobacter oryzisoli TaxID=2925408 RepID=UPI001F5A78EE|nr:DoxX family protein [Anaeromyxobacter sp. SG63]